jgi:hypothetical protein
MQGVLVLAIGSELRVSRRRIVMNRAWLGEPMRAAGVQRAR